MHVRVHTSAPFIYLDHRYFHGSDTLEHSSCCKGHPGSLEDLEGCATQLVASAIAQCKGMTQADGDIVVLWATDNDELTGQVLQCLQSMAGVLVVRIVHEGKDRTDQLPWTGMLDVSLLEEADVLIGTPVSTFSYTAHARGLIPAYYPSFRGSRSTACGKPVETEGGLLFHGSMYDECFWMSPVQAECTQHRSACLHTISGTIGHEKCLQGLGPCLAEDVSWASPYLVDADLEGLSLHFLARRSIHFKADLQPSVHRTCPPAKIAV
jgi:hypothetical protein